MSIQIKIPKVKKAFKKGSLVINPEAYWIAILFIFSATVVLAFAFGYVLFKKVSQDPSISDEEARSRALVQEERLVQTLQYFRSREQKSLNITASPSPIVDPSL
jgi:hypothetical protein